jgi:hypothetical protein
METWNHICGNISVRPFHVDHDSSFGPLLASRGPRRDVHTWDRDEIQFGTERKAGAQTLSGQSGASVQLVMVRVAVESELVEDW